ncbi:D-amino acid dehydrogenase small subunit [Nocardioides dokdonensis FR1436]|uniref:D-amino acid dehydrogenase small subunit n=1 Tax=Nocardioides dokdonensis FR1436 TaxID=1300347 RepID=A0A1A9GI74_9ACTN|nr:FAD-dependent oxidoreductase [Nocardioides dokdonensis]ANH37313.1 D-amino acid dehydrogenase small subunit [Nocardioides dokdonensis FR1436]
MALHGSPHPAAPGSSNGSGPAPRSVAVIGAGMVGLATAWHLQERGVQVTVLERSRVAAGSSWGNAGWLTPGLTVPLPDPGTLRYGIRTGWRPSSPLYIPLQPDLRLARFLTGFARHCTSARWAAGTHAYSPMNAEALDAFAELADAGGAPRPTPAAPFLAAFRTEHDREHLVEALDTMRRTGQRIDYDLLDAAQSRALEPALSAEVGAGLRLEGQEFIDPPAYMEGLAASVRERGGSVLEGCDVTGVHDEGTRVRVVHTGGVERFDAVVLATGAWLERLAAPLGVRRLVQAGRGYSFSVAGDAVPERPVYFPTQRVACTPIRSATGRRLRVAGMMEFRSPDAPLDPRRISAIVDAVRPLLTGFDLDDRQDEWVGSRPVTTDGLPLIGASRSPRVFVGGGHGMWGVALGPLTGRLLAQQMTTGVTPVQLQPFDPLR